MSQNNVERVQYYNDLEIEADPTLPTDPGPEWPSVGAIEFDNVQLRYRPDLPLVLKGLTFTINPGEKVGIIGRTGAGKSSIAQALFRTVELCGGKIGVDGRDLKGVGLDTVGRGLRFRILSPVVPLQRHRLAYVTERLLTPVSSYGRDWRSYRKTHSSSAGLSGTPLFYRLRTALTVRVSQRQHRSDQFADRCGAQRRPQSHTR